MMREKLTHSITNANGFTLIEALIVLTISSVIIAGIYSSFSTQQKSYSTQNEVAIMQQNIRAASNHMAREIRMAGYGPVKNKAAITTAKPSKLVFTYEKDKDGNLRTIEYRSYDAFTDGTNDIGLAIDSGPISLLAENIQALEFQYLDKDGKTTNSESKIKTIRVSILARADQPDPDYTNNIHYFPASCDKSATPSTVDTCVKDTSWAFSPGTANHNAFDDNFRRRLLITTIHLRNS